MNSWTSKQRKTAYIVGILVLLLPIVSLGMPGGAKLGKDDTVLKEPGGVLDQMRSKYDLGESDLGAIDPSSSAMNLVLLGLRGIAVNILWIKMDDYKDHKQWAEMRATSESIIRLQPHFEKVWDFNGWNLAFNVSAEWDDVKDRYYWVKEGGKFFQRGVKRNAASTMLIYKSGSIYLQKIGHSDETKFFRKYFLSDPDPKWSGKQDLEFNPEGIDNFLVAKEWFERANIAEENRRNGMMERTLFRGYPARAQFDYAQVLQKEGSFGENTKIAWEEAYRMWTKEYGQYLFKINVPNTDRFVEVKLETTLEDIEQLGKTDTEREDLKLVVNAYQNMCNYRYWRTRALCEAEQTTLQAHKDFYDAIQEYKKANLGEALTLNEAAIAGFEKVLDKYRELREEDNLVEECLSAVHMMRTLYQLRGEPVPDEYPLKWLWDAQDTPRLVEIKRTFERQFLVQ